MSRIIRLFGSQSIALLALCVALSGGAAFAVGKNAPKNAPKNSVVSKSIKNGQVTAADLAPGAVTGAAVTDESLGTSDVQGLTGADVSDNSLSGADVDESTLGSVPRAGVATLGGLGRGVIDKFCNPDTLAYATCATVAITVPAASNLLLFADAKVAHQTNNDYIAQGECRFTLDGATVPGSMWVSKAADETYATSSMTRLAGVAAGAHTLTLECNDTYYATYSSIGLQVVGLSAG